MDAKLGGTVRCAALYRVSTPKQAARRDEGEETLPVQRQAVRRFVDSHAGWSLVEEFAEEGVSAYRNSSDERDILQDVLRNAAARKFEVLLVFKADRLSRKSVEYPFILTGLKKAGVRVISVADDVGGRELKLDGQSDKLMRFIEGWQAETESLNTSIRVSEAMRQMAQKGRWTGGRPPFGFRLDKEKSPVPLAIDEEEAQILRRAFALYLDQNLGTPTITYQLNEAGARQRNGSPWSDGSLRRVMQNPIVCGRLAYGRTTRKEGNKQRSRVGAHSFEGVIVSESNPDLVIVSVERWTAAMARMESYNNARPAGEPTWGRADTGALLFTGMARCAHCGGPLVRTSVRGFKTRKDGSRLRDVHTAYLCLTKASRGQQFCDGQRTYSAKKVESALLAAMRETLSVIPTHEIVAEARRQAEQSAWSTSTRADALERKISEATIVRDGWLKRLDAFFVHPEKSLYSEDVLAMKVRQAEEELASLKRGLAEIKGELEQSAAQRERLEAFLGQATQWWRRVLDAPRAQQKALLKQVVSKVVVGRQGFEIHWRISPDALAKESAVRWRQSRQWPTAADA